MSSSPVIRVAIVDFGLGNLHSVRRACEHAGLTVSITADPREIQEADGVLLPGVGAFGDAMATLRRLGLVEVLQETAGVGRPLMGVCLGVQLLMQESEEFGRSEGLGIIEGNVVRFDRPRMGARELKVPEVGWNRIHRRSGAPADVWKDGPLDGISDGEHLYFVHSYYVRPSDPSVILSLTRYGDVEYCSSIARGSVFACQFHPERSGEEGLKIYRNWAAAVQRHKEGTPLS